MENPAKFKCSFGSQIRRHEGDHFSYDGGNHKMLHVPGDINFDGMTAELSNLFPGATVTSFKYLIPGDDFLITVDNDRDHHNFMREYNQHCRGSGSPSPMRIFIDAANQGSPVVAPPGRAPENASNDDRAVKMEVEGQVEWKWVRFVGSASFSLPGLLTLPSSLFLLVALILLLCLPIALLVLLQNYSITKEVAEVGNFELHHDNYRLIQLDKPIIQLTAPGILVVPAKDDEYTIEMVLHDKKGSEIHASIPKVLVKKFCPVANIFQNGNIDCKELIDISAEVVGKEGRQIVITLEDMDKSRVSCTLFGTLVAHIFPHLHSIGPGPLIVELHIVSAKSFPDKVHVQSSYYASKLHVNVYIKEDVNSKNRLGSSCQITSQHISCPSSLPSCSVSDEINGELVRMKSIGEILDCENESSYWILASIVRLDVGKDDWFYKGCTRCPQKLEDAEPFYCKRCDTADYDALLRFRLQVIVSDGTGSMTLVLWDWEAMQLVGKTATEIIENSFDDDDTDTYPKALESVIDTKLLIEVAVSSRNINDYDDVFNVTRISDDEQIDCKICQ